MSGDERDAARAPRLVPERCYRIVLGLDAKELDVRHRRAIRHAPSERRSCFQIAARRLSSSTAYRACVEGVRRGAAPPRAPRPQISPTAASPIRWTIRDARRRTARELRRQSLRTPASRSLRTLRTKARSTARPSCSDRARPVQRDDAAVAGTGAPSSIPGRSPRVTKHAVSAADGGQAAPVRRHRAALHRIPRSVPLRAEARRTLLRRPEPGRRCRQCRPRFARDERLGSNSSVRSAACRAARATGRRLSRELSSPAPSTGRPGFVPNRLIVFMIRPRPHDRSPPRAAMHRLAAADGPPCTQETLTVEAPAARDRVLRERNAALERVQAKYRAREAPGIRPPGGSLERSPLDSTSWQARASRASWRASISPRSDSPASLHLTLAYLQRPGPRRGSTSHAGSDHHQMTTGPARAPLQPLIGPSSRSKKPVCGVATSPGAVPRSPTAVDRGERPSFMPCTATIPNLTAREQAHHLYRSDTARPGPGSTMKKTASPGA